MDKRRAILSEKMGRDVLTLDLKNESVEIDFNNNEQNYLREVFYSIIENVLEEDFEFEYRTADNYEKKLYIEIAQEYIKQLNSEMRSIKDANGGFSDAERRHFWNRLDGDRDGTKAA